MVVGLHIGVTHVNQTTSIHKLYNQTFTRIDKINIYDYTPFNIKKEYEYESVG